MKMSYLSNCFIMILIGSALMHAQNRPEWNRKSATGNPPVNDIVVGPFLSLPNQFVTGTAYNIKARFTNGGTANQTNIPARFSINGVLIGTGNIASLPSGAVDSASFIWTPLVAGTYILRIYSAALIDENRLNDTATTSVAVTPSGSFQYQTTICRNGLNKLIPDNNSFGVADTIAVSIPIGTHVFDVNVRIDTVVHSWDNDLKFTLTRLTQNVVIIDHVGGSGDNFINTVLNDSGTTSITNGTAPFTGIFRPSNLLSAFNGLLLNGIWILRIEDNAAGDTGYLKAWCLQLMYNFSGINKNSNKIPETFFLDQNYPNPFNPITKITFGLPKESFVSLMIYDMLGRKIINAINEIMRPGIYTLDFDGTEYSSGVYFYKVFTDEHVDVKKMVLIK